MLVLDTKNAMFVEKRAQYLDDIVRCIANMVIGLANRVPETEITKDAYTTI